MLHCSSVTAASRMPIMDLQRSTFVDRLLTGRFPAPNRAGVPDGGTWIDLKAYMASRGVTRHPREHGMHDLAPGGYPTYLSFARSSGRVLLEGA